MKSKLLNILFISLLFNIILSESVNLTTANAVATFQVEVCAMDTAFCNGCKDDTALNYDPIAMNEDSSECVYLLGDLNNDGSINVLDLVMMSNIIVGNIDPDEYMQFAGDMNGDGIIDVLDMIILQDMILLTRSEGDDGEIIISKVLNPYGVYENEDASMTVNMMNDTAVRVVFASISIDAGYNVSSVVNGDRTLYMEYQTNLEEESNTLSFILYNSEGWAISEGAGAILEIGLQSIGLDRSTNPNMGEFIEIQAANSAERLLPHTIVSSDIMDGYIEGKSSMSELPEKYSLYPAYPNPFNAVTNIRFDLPVDSYSEVMIYDIRGRLVSELVKGQLNSGSHSFSWDATGFASGIYIVTLSTPEFDDQIKVLLLK